MSISPVDRFFVIFMSIVIEALPFIIIGALISGILEELLPQKLFARLIPKQRWLAIAGSACLGLVFPMCECGIVPVMRRLLGKGLPLSCAVAYMLAAPIINPVVIGSTWAAFSGDRSRLDGLSSFQMVSLRVGLAFLVANVVAFVVNRLERRRGINALIRPIHKAHAHDDHHHHGDGKCDHEHPHEHGPECAHGHQGHHHDEHAHAHPHEHAHKEVRESLAMAGVHSLDDEADDKDRSILQRLGRISEIALHDFVDIAAFLILGAILAALVQTFGVMNLLPQYGGNPFLAAAAMMLLAVLLCLCSEADAFVAANLIAIPLAGKVAFLVLGPMLDLKLYLMYTRVFRRRLIWTIIGTVVVTVFALSIATHYLDQWQSPAGR